MDSAPGEDHQSIIDAVDRVRADVDDESWTRRDTVDTVADLPRSY